MGLLIDFCYAIAFLVALPFLLFKSIRTGKYRTGWPGRFGRGDDVFPHRSNADRILLLHCVSVGELLSVQTLVQRLLAADPRVHIVISTTTDTGTARAESLYPADPGLPTHHARVATVRFPLDFAFAVESFFDRVRPDAIALVELETWPMFLAIARSRRIPAVIVNGRLSERSFPRYLWIRPLMAAMLEKLEWIGVQTPTIAKRFRALGAADAQLAVIPTLKYDNASFAERVPGQEALARAMGLWGEQALFVAGSTGPGEEAAVLDAYLAVRGRYPQLRLAVAPRKPEAVPPLVEAIAQRGLRTKLRTGYPDGSAGEPLAGDEVFVLDTLGELKKLYALAAAVFVGRSLVKMGGSDMIEAAALAKPTCFGPYTQNFAEVVELLVGEGAAIEVKSGEELAKTIEKWLESPGFAREMGVKSQEVLRAQRGSTDVYVDRLVRLLALKESREG